MCWRSSAVGDDDGDGGGDGDGDGDDKRLDNDNNNGFFSARKNFISCLSDQETLANCLGKKNGNIFPSFHRVESKRVRDHWLDWMIVCKDWIRGWSLEQLGITWVKFGSVQAKANSLDAFKVPWLALKYQDKIFNCWTYYRVLQILWSIAREWSKIKWPFAQNLQIPSNSKLLE